MKTSYHSKLFRCATGAIVVLLTSTTGVAQSQGSSSSGTTNTRNSDSSQQQNQNRSQTQRSQNQGSQSAGKEVRVTRASTFLGSDVMATDNEKVGDISDFYFDPSGAPHLRYVVITTGGFLGIGGDARAVPPEALTSEGDTVKLNLSSDEFWDVAVMPQNQKRFLSNPRNTEQLAQTFNVSGQRAANTGAARNQSAKPGNQDASSNQSNQSGRNAQQTLVSFSDLRATEAFGKDGQELGRVVDTWVSLNLNRAPYVEISAGPASAFETRPPFYRFAIPMTRLQPGTDDFLGYNFDITEDEMRDSNMVTDAKGVELVQSGFVGREILRVTVPDTTDRSRSAAE